MIDEVARYISHHHAQTDALVTLLVFICSSSVLTTTSIMIFVRMDYRDRLFAGLGWVLGTLAGGVVGMSAEEIILIALPLAIATTLYVLSVRRRTRQEETFVGWSDLRRKMVLPVVKSGE